MTIVFPRALLISVVLGLIQGQLEAAESKAKSDAAPPNVIVILADDFGYECVGANGGTSYSTPNLDRLAETGVRYAHCYTQPLCTPTRAQLMTGQLNVRNYVRFGFLDPQQTTFAHLLKAVGYSTGVFGKWQLANGPKSAQHFGFDESVLWQQTRRPPRYANPGLEINGREVDFSNGEYGPDLVQTAALDFISSHKDKPFLLYYPMILTHGPFQPTPDSAGWDPKAIGEEVNNEVKYFADMVAHMDGHVGQIVSHLEELEIRDNTLIIFVGDNGTAGRISSEWNGKTIKGAKGTTTDAGMRVPLIVNWPQKIKAARVVTDLVDTTDVFPTLCEAADLIPPGDLVLDGRSLLPSATGQNGEPREWLYSWYWPNQNAQAAAPVEFARTHRHKLFTDGRLFELDGEYGERELDVKSLDRNGQSAKELLEKAIAKFKDARPASLKSSATHGSNDQ